MQEDYQRKLRMTRAQVSLALETHDRMMKVLRGAGASHRELARHAANRRRWVDALRTIDLAIAGD